MTRKLKVSQRVALAALPAFLFAIAAADRASAVIIPGGIMLPDATVNGQLAISLLAYSQTLSAPGTKYLTPPIYIPGGNGAVNQACDAAGYCDYGSGEISAILGADPQILLSAMPANGGGGESTLFMSYDVVYAGVPTGTPVAAMVLTGDSLTQDGLSAADAIMTVSGVNGTVYEAYNCEAAPGAAFGCSTALTNAPFPDAPVELIAGEPYTVNLTVDIYANGDVSAAIDPRFTAPASYGGEFYYSSGITSGVPEPATWALMIVGLGALGARLRQRRARTTQRPAPDLQERSGAAPAAVPA